MDIEHIRDCLTQTGQGMINLATKLNRKGDPLDEWEKSIIKTAMLPMVKEQLDIALLQYLTGRRIDIDLKRYEVDF